MGASRRATLLHNPVGNAGDARDIEDSSALLGGEIDRAVLLVRSLLRGPAGAGGARAVTMMPGNMGPTEGA